jgi:hypothetical protein
MTVTYTFDVFSSLDGFGAASGNWTGYWGKQGPELLNHRLAHRVIRRRQSRMSAACARNPTPAQQSNADQQMSFRNRWSSSTSSRIASGS